MEYVVLGIFSLFLFICLFFDITILYALLGGLLLFTLHGIRQGFSLREIVRFAYSGIRTVRHILLTFILIGIMTALWREAGTIPTIVCHSTSWISPPAFLLMTFLLNCLISVLTGTAFGTAATMGVICAAMGASLGVSPFLTGGAILSGVYFGDRCSPISTSALLVSALTGTNIYTNIKGMIRSAVVPFAMTCAVYAAVGYITTVHSDIPNLSAVFAAFDLSWLTVLPAVVLLALALLRVNVKLAMTASISAAIPICLFVQHTPMTALPSLIVWGYTSQDPEIASMLSGGGIVSMLTVAAIVCISSAYSGIFRQTGLLTGIKTAVSRLAYRTTPFASALVTSVMTGMIACNQTLTIMLTDQLCRDTDRDSSRFAITLEDTAVVIAPLVPWSIAAAVPLTSVGAPPDSVLFACFLYLLPIWQCITASRTRSHTPS